MKVSTILSESKADDNNQKRYALVVIADGFEETAATVFISLLRQAGLYVKSVGLTKGLIGGAHGMWLMPDLTLTDLDLLINTMSICVVILPEGRQSLVKLETDLRVHRLLRQVVAQRGQIVTSREGVRVLQAAAMWGNEQVDANDDRGVLVILRDPGQSLEAFARDLVRRLK